MLGCAIPVSRYLAIPVSRYPGIPVSRYPGIPGSRYLGIPSQPQVTNHSHPASQAASQTASQGLLGCAVCWNRVFSDPCRRKPDSVALSCAKLRGFSPTGVGENPISAHRANQSKPEQTLSCAKLRKVLKSGFLPQGSEKTRSSCAMLRYVALMLHRFSPTGVRENPISRHRRLRFQGLGFRVKG